MLTVGDTVMLPKPGHEKEHLWALITAPDPESGDAIMVNLTTQRPHSDTTTIIQPGEHPFVDRPTIVFYADARTVNVNALEGGLRQGVVRQHTAFGGTPSTHSKRFIRLSVYTQQNRNRIQDSAREGTCLTSHRAMLLQQPASIQHQARRLWYHGNRELLDKVLHGVLCSKACPGEKIIEAIDLAQRWRAENRAVISGFHTPVEKECLRIFLRGPQRIVICPARGLDPFQVAPDWQQKFKRGELLIVSPFDSSIRRPTKETAEIRTRLVLSLAQSKTIIHACPGGSLSRLAASKA